MINKEVEQFKQKLIDEKKEGLILDIDETLSWTIGYWVCEMQKHFGNPENLSIKNLIKRYHYTQNVPYWQTPKALEWMENARENDLLQEELSLIENSNDMVQKINQIIPIVGYLTIRPQSVLSGTTHWLNKHNFPSEPIITRPKDVISSEGNIWKAEVLHFLYPQVVGIVDDNPSVVEKLPSDYKGTVYFYDNDKCMREDINIIPCKTWSDVHYHVNLLHGKTNK
jgi:hypothetical protein